MDLLVSILILITYFTLAKIPDDRLIYIGTDFPITTQETKGRYKYRVVKWAPEYDYFHEIDPSFFTLSIYFSYH